MCHRKTFSLFLPDVWSAVGDIDFGLGSSGDRLCLFDGRGNLADLLSYDCSVPWPEGANGKGPVDSFVGSVINGECTPLIIPGSLVPVSQKILHGLLSPSYIALPDYHEGSTIDRVCTTYFQEIHSCREAALVDWYCMRTRRKCMV